jgi:hypothetical protein
VAFIFLDSFLKFPVYDSSYNVMLYFHALNVSGTVICVLFNTC